MFAKCYFISAIVFWIIAERDAVKRLDTYCNIANYPYYLYLEMVKDNDTAFCAASLITSSSALTTAKCCRTMSERRNVVYRGYKVNVGSFVEKRDVIPMPTIHDFQNYCIIKFLPFNVTESVAVSMSTSASSLLYVSSVCNTYTVELIGETKQKNSFFDGFHCIKREIRPNVNCKADMRDNPVFTYDESTMFCHYHARVNDRSCKTMAGSPIMHQNLQIGIETSFLENGNCVNNFSLAVRTDVAYDWIEDHKRRMALTTYSDANLIKFTQKCHVAIALLRFLLC